ncbi:MAG: GAF domain-containing protein, partial [Candidatus Omnitrophica bacterium]|nr:GAF domain-containing protein [Candidatus Omnitrophota bacterium]
MAGLIFTISNCIVWVTCIILIIILFVYGKKKVHYMWAYFNFVGGLWGLGGFLVGLSKAPTVAMISWKIALIGSIFSPIVFYHMITVLGDLNRKKILYIFYAFGMFFYLLTLFDFLDLSITRIHDSLFYVKATNYKWGLLVSIWGMIVACAIVELFVLLKQSTGAKRTQYQFIFIGFVAAFSGAILDTLPMWGLNFLPAANLLISFYCVLVTYAILRHNLLDIEVIIKKTLVFAGLFIFAYTVFATFAYIGTTFLENVVNNRWIAMMPSVFIVVMLLRPLESFLRNITDKYLFQKQYDSKQLLKLFANEVLSVLDINRLVNLTVNRLVDFMKLENAYIMLLDENREMFRVVAFSGMSPSKWHLDAQKEFFAYLQVTGKYLLLDDPARKNILNPSIVSVMADERSVLAIPLFHRNEMVGVLFLGKKKSDEIFNQEDIDILLPLSRTLSIAITNAQLFEKLSQAQAQAAQREKMAVIGTLSAGINHE